MRNHFRTETFPTLDEVVKVFAQAKDAKYYCKFLNMYYNTLFNMSKVLGFSLVRLDFKELFCIVHKTSCVVIIELRMKK